MNELDTKVNGYEGQRQAQTWSGDRELQAPTRVLSQAADWSLRSFRDEAEIHAINSALRQTGWNRTQAARLLSISYRSLLYKIRRHNITPNPELQDAQAKGQR